MEFVHSTILHENDLRHCIVVESSNPIKVDVLLVYKYRIEYGSIVVLIGEDISYFPQKTFQIETPILWAYAFEDNLLTFTESNNFIVSNFSRILESISVIKIPQFEGTTYKYFSLSPNQNIVCAATDSDSCVFINIRDVNMPYVRTMCFPGEIIESTISGNSKNCIILLLSNKQTGQRQIAYVDGNNQTILETRHIESSLIGIIFNCDSDGKYNDNTFLKVLPNKIVLDEDNQLALPSKPVTWSNINHKRAIVFLEDHSMIEFNLEFKRHRIYKDCPDLSSLILLDNSTILCIPKKETSFFMHFYRLPEEQIEEQFSKIKITPIQGYRTIQSGIYYNNKLLMSGDHVVSYVTSMHDPEVLPLAVNTIEYTPGTKIYSFESALIVTTENTTKLLRGSIHILEGDVQTIKFYYYRKRLIQITKDSIVCGTKTEFEFENQVLYAACDNDYLVVCLDNMVIRNFFKTTKKCSKFQMPYQNAIFTALALNGTFIAVALEFTEERKYQIFFYDMNLTDLSQSFYVPSKVNQLMFRNEVSELLVSLDNGSLFVIHVSNEGVSKDIAYIHYGKSPIQLFEFGNDYLILEDSNLFCVQNCHLVDTGLRGVSTLVVVENNDLLLLIAVINGEIFQKEYSQFSEMANTMKVSSKGPALRFNTFEDKCIVSHKEGIYVIKDMEVLNEINLADVTNFTSCYRENGECILYVVTGTNEQMIQVYSFNNIEYTKLYTQKVSNNIYCLESFNHYLLFGFNNSLRIAVFENNKIIFRRAIINSKYPVTNIVTQDEFIWTIFGKKEISIFVYNTQSDRFEIVAEYKQFCPIEINAIAILDDNSAAIGEENGTISIIQIPNSALLGFVRQYHGEVPKITCISRLKLYSPIQVLIKTPHSLIYGTKNGNIGGMIPISSTRDFSLLSEYENKMRDYYFEQVGFSRPSPFALSQQKNIINLDLVDTFHQVLNEEDIKSLNLSKKFYSDNYLMKVRQCLDF